MAGILDAFKLDGKTALVTGASTGLGQGMAEGLAEAGADVIVAARSVDKLEAVRDTIRGMGRKSEVIPTDVNDTGAIRDMVARAKGVNGRIDILVANAGTTYRSQPEEFPEEEWRRVIEVNLNAVWFSCQEAGKLMVDQKRGKIVATASLLTFQGGITVPAYAASKGAVGQLVKALANDWAKHDIQVNGIAPGYFETNMTEALQKNETRARQVIERIPADRWGQPSDLKGAVVYLSSDASNYVTGHLLVVDGGWMGR